MLGSRCETRCASRGDRAGWRYSHRLTPRRGLKRKGGSATSSTEQTQSKRAMEFVEARGALGMVGGRALTMTNGSCLSGERTLGTQSTAKWPAHG
eukprot:984890-Pleurochrysis_carterae.AAC.1